MQEVLRADAAFRGHNAVWVAAFKGAKAKAENLLARMQLEVARAKALVSMICQSMCMFLEEHTASGGCGVTNPSISRIYVRLLGNNPKPLILAAQEAQTTAALVTMERRLQREAEEREAAERAPRRRPPRRLAGSWQRPQVRACVLQYGVAKPGHMLDQCQLLAALCMFRMQ